MTHPPSADDGPSDLSQDQVDADAARRALQRYFAQHNWQALALALVSLLASALLWAITYLFVYWFSLVGVTLARSLNPQTLLQVNDPLLGAHFPRWFAIGGCAALALAAMVRKQVRVARLREARLYLLWVLVELFMAIPNVTFSIFGNLAAMTRLRRREAAAAWKLLQRINREGGRLHVVNLRQEIEDEKTLRRVMFGLQLVGLVSVRERQEGWFLYLQNREAFARLLSHAHVPDG